MSSVRTFHGIVSSVALQNSRLRKLDRLEAASNLDSMPDCLEEMDRDWKGAIGWLLEWVMAGPCSFSSLDRSFLRELELTWFDDVKEYKAYCSWRANWPSGGVWTSVSQQQGNFYQALAQIRTWFIDEKNKLDSSEFELASRHIQERFLRNGALELDNEAVNELVKRKARRAWERTGDSAELENWSLAEGYVKAFYESVIPALKGHRSDCAQNLIMVVQAQSMLASGFEAALLARFVDPEAILECERRTGKMMP